MPADDVFHDEERRVPGHLGLRPALHVVDQTIHVILLGHHVVPTVHSVRNDVLDDESSDLVAPVRHSGHVPVVKRHEERQEVGRVSLIHLEEHLVEVLDHVSKTVVLQMKVLGAEIRDEDVGAAMEDQRFRVNARARQRVQMVHHKLHLIANYTVQLVETRGEGAGKGVRAKHLPSGFLHIRPVAKCQGCKIKWGSLFFFFFSFYHANGFKFEEFNSLITG